MKRLLLLLFVSLLTIALTAQTYSEIGTGTTSTNLPTYALWNYAWSTAIYPASGFGGARNITQIAYQHINTVNSTLNNQKIYLKESTTNSFASNSYEEPTAAGFTLVYNGAVSTATGWTVIDITDFNYSGTGNLIVHWENRSGTSNYTTDWYATDCGTGVIKCGGSDSTFPSAGGWAPYPLALPNLRFYYSTSNPATPGNPVPANNESAVFLNGSLSFNLGINTSSYQLKLGTSTQNMQIVANQQISSPGTYTYTPNTPWLPTTTYFWQVVAVNASGTTEGPIWNFNTEGLITALPFAEGFESTTFPPTGWYRNSEAWSRAAYPQNGTHCAKVSYNHTNPAILRSPRILLPSTPVRLKFYWADTDNIPRIAQHDTTYVEISNDLGQNWTILGHLAAASYQNSYQEFSIDLPNYANQEIYLRWRDVTDGSLYAYGTLLDGVLLEPISSNPVISLNPASLNFPETGVGLPLTSSISISNLGSSNLSISSVSASGPFSCTTPPVIGASQTVTVPITYLPETPGNHTGTITFQINGSFSGNNVLNLSGSAYALQTGFFENFDGSMQLPPHWIGFEDGTNQFTTVQVRNSSMDAYSGTNSLRMYNSAEDVEDVNIMLISPALSNLSANTLTFFAKSSWGIATDTMILGYMSDPYNSATFTALQTINLSQNYVQHSINIPPTAIGNFIVFKHGLGNAQNYGIYLDDISWEAGGNVPNPATAVYPAPSATEVRLDYIGRKLGSKLQWSSGGGNPTGYKIYLGTSVSTFDLINGTDLGLADTLTVASSLNYSTSYYWKVVPYNADGDALNCPVWIFTTMSDPTVQVTSSNPWIEGFETAAIGTIPLGWELDNLDNDTSYWTAIGNSSSSQNSHSGNRAVHISFSFMTTHNDWLYSPPLNLRAGSSYTVSFWYKSIDFPGDECIEKLELKWGNLPSPEAMTGSLFYNDNIVSPTPYTRVTATLNPSSDGVYFLGFHCFSAPMQFVLLVDDISVSEIPSVNEEQISQVLTGLRDSYPNPFSHTSNIRYYLETASQIDLSIYNIRGQLVKRLDSAHKQAGEHSLVWDGLDHSGAPVASGSYYIVLKTGLHTYRSKLLKFR